MRKHIVAFLFAPLFCIVCGSFSVAKYTSSMEKIADKSFPTFQVPENVEVFKVGFDNQYGMRLAGYLFMPENLKGKAKGIIIGHPMGASKEQAACFTPRDSRPKDL